MWVADDLRYAQGVAYLFKLVSAPKLFFTTLHTIHCSKVKFERLGESSAEKRCKKDRLDGFRSIIDDVFESKSKANFIILFCVIGKAVVLSFESGLLVLGIQYRVE